MVTYTESRMGPEAEPKTAMPRGLDMEARENDQRTQTFISCALSELWES